MATAAQSVRRERRPRRGTASILLTFLGSMNLAITLLVALAVASVIGTVLQQGQPYPDYLLKFGPFWFEVYKALGLYDVYSAPWFLFILSFLVVSTSVCLVRHTPFMWKEMTRFREHQQERSLRALSHRSEWDVAMDPGAAADTAEAALRRHGFRVRRKPRKRGELVAAMSGAANRLGYVFTHLGIVVICVGGLIDGNVLLQWQYWTGDLTVETRDIPVSQVDESSRLPPRPGAFRGNVTIPEGGSAGVAFLRMGEGYVVQELPFRLKVEDFRIEHYDTGQPQSFESDVVLQAPGLEEPIEQTIRVNEPLEYNGYAIYQANFGDGGSRLDLRLWPLDGGEPATMEARVNGEAPLPDSGPRLEVTDFSVFNIHPRPDAVNNRDVRNVGPSFTFRLRRETGEAVEYRNYMQPVAMDGGRYYLSGMRRSPADEFRYLHIPADPDGELDRFMALLEQLRGEESVAAAADRAMQDIGVEQEQVRRQVAREAHGMIDTLLESGFDAVLEQQRQRAEARAGEAPERLMDFYRLVLERTLWEAYARVLTREGSDPAEPTEEDLVFYRDAITAMTALADYGAPVFLELTNFDHRQATGLQIARAPGQNVVYTGALMLTVGVFLLFYVAHRRMWCWVRPGANGAHVLLAGSSHRDPIGFARVFERLQADLAQRFRPHGPADSTGARPGERQ
ncbi:cytochrome c biogenesis protein ResB [Aquisalimonas lutea]|uniref:cytochrome c biogenesis protein ResB n=1 Tax=Aquisalimonas lutea TaxID=1327750 RepID=UPI0025B616B7|nr:cytochrome c biogenesis protein ResB [Aquisalimonas lutea]MDN3516499.1 cytochrome c biogenesis protein ResB [Aquisalimonas lutea]